MSNVSLNKKLLIAFLTIIIIPNSILGIFCYYYFSNALMDKVIKSANMNNEQIAKNIDSYLISLARLSEYPNLDVELNNILKKNYPYGDNGLVENMDDMVKARSSLYRGVLYMNNLIDSAAIFPENSNYIYWKGMEDTINFEVNIKNEKWYSETLKAEGKEIVVGVHRDYLLTRKGEYVISVARNIVNPYTKISLGAIVINTKVKNISNLWKDVSITPNSKIFIIDDKENIINSSNSSDIGKFMKDIPEFVGTNDDTALKETNIYGEVYYINITNSEYNNWRVISLIPKNELFKEIDNIKYVTILLSLVLILISIGISTIIARGITRPILKLKNTMKLVEKGDFEIKADILGGEVGELGSTFNKLVSEMKNLINKISVEESEKRDAELAAMQAQISPHFLYNTLNTIKWMANIQGSSGIVKSLTSLIELLTFASKIKGHYITIGQELEQLEHYLNILNLRYYDKFKVDFNIDNNVYNYATLKYLLQPVVENAIIHGMENVDAGGLINIKIEKVDNKIIYDITDNGEGIEQSKIKEIFSPEYSQSDKKFNRIGINNVSKRIKLEFGNEFGITIQSEIGSFTKVHIEIPTVQMEL